MAATRGADGAVVVDADGERAVPAFEVDVVDTTGCGDAFSAGFLRGLALGRDRAQAATLGCACAALVATGLGSDHGTFDLTRRRRLCRTDPDQEHRPVMTPDTDSGQSPITRRRFVAGSLVTGAAVAVPGAAEAKAKASPSPSTSPAKPKSTVHQADVAIVGAGLSGLTAARQIAAAGKSVIVLEARGRVGGRCFSRSIGSGASDVANMGATFVGPSQTQILGLMSELGIGKFDVYSTGNLLWYESGKLTPYTGLIPPANDPASVIELGEVVLPEIDKMAQTVPLDAPWTAPDALPWDSITVDSWVGQNTKGSDTPKLFTLAVDAILSVLPRDVSFLYFLFYVHAAGGIEPLVNNAGQGGAQDFRVSGGTQGIADQGGRPARPQAGPALPAGAPHLPGPQERLRLRRQGHGQGPAGDRRHSAPPRRADRLRARAARRCATSSPSGCRSAR